MTKWEEKANSLNELDNAVILKYNYLGRFCKSP